MKLHHRSKWKKITHGKEAIGVECCPFCNNIIKEEEEKLIIWKSKYWNVVHNKYPYNGLKNHLMAVSVRHVETTKDLSKEEFGELQEVENFMHSFYNGQDFFSFIRETNNGKTIKHLHYHFLPGVLYSRVIEGMLKKQNIS